MKDRMRSAKCEGAVLRRARSSGAIYVALALLLAALGSGCATSRSVSVILNRPFVFQQDTMAYANQLVWEYYFDANGKWRSKAREPKPDYTHHCFVVARAARQFFQHARFDATRPVTDEASYRRLIHRVISESPRTYSAEAERIVIPGYANLHDFSAAQEALLKAECGGAWQSYFQRGHWRMVFWFSRAQQAQTAEALVNSLKRNRPPVIHLVKFPQLTINHAVVLFDARETPTEIQFATYDPNKAEKPTVLTYDRARRTFSFPANDYFSGGRVNVYEIYLNLCY